MGTADFIAPEQAHDPREADIRADIYSLGCTLYYLLAGHAPFPEGSAPDKLTAHRERVPAPLAKLRSDVPSGLTRVMERMMAMCCAFRASFGKCSLMRMPGTEVWISRKGPPFACPGFRSKVSIWLGPPFMNR